jgi:hypothetical protein
MISPTITKPELKAMSAVLRDPVRFAKGILQHDVWDTQAEILRSTVENRDTAVKACHASSKTFSAAEVTLFWLTRYDDGIVITTAPVWKQVERQLWGEIHKAAAKSRIAYPTMNKTDLTIEEGVCFALGLSTNEAERFQGFHGHILIIVDEAPGVRPAIWEAIEGIRAGGDVHVLALGNPTIASGPFYEAFTSQRKRWNTITINAFDTPNLRGLTIEDLLVMPEHELDRNERPYLVSRRWVKERYEEWGPTHPLYQARVLGKFPEQAEDALISLGWLEESKYREVKDTGNTTMAGLDVAGPGEDETSLLIREGRKLLKLQSWTKPDPRGEVVAALMPYKDRLDQINVDEVGIGYYMLRHLQDLGFNAVGVNVGEAPRNREKYINRKAELYWGLRQRFQAGDIDGLEDEVAIAQLTGIRYSHNARGQVVIESKDDARKRGVKSPDRAEAIMLAFASDSAASFSDLQEAMAEAAREDEKVPMSVAEIDELEDEPSAIKEF